MALTSALNMAISGMMTTALKTNLTSQNISNADKAGYSRKDLQVAYLSTSSGSTPVAGIVVGVQDKFIVSALVDDISAFNFHDAVAQSLDYYASQLGNTAGTNTVSSYLDDLYSRLQYLATNPESAANKAQVVEIAGSLSNALRSLSGSIQDLRQEAEHKIAASITQINASLDRIDLLNDKITGGANNDASLAEYEDQRALELQKLSQEMDIQYFYTSDNRLQIYSGNGQAMLLSDPHHIDYTVTNVVDSSKLYPADFSPIDLDGADLTTIISGGRLAGYIQLRDTNYVQEQAKLTELANTMRTQVNTLLNTGASVPSRNPLAGSLAGLTVATPFTATGTIQVAITDNTGMVVSSTNINLAAMATVNDVLTALNGIAGITASLNANGELSIATAVATNGVSINQMTSAITSSTGESFGQYFGLNDLFVGTSAENIDVADYLKTGPQYLAIGILDPTAAAGTRGVNRGDGTVADSLADMLNSSATTFNAAGNFSAQSNSIISYAQAIMSDAASQASLSQLESDTSYQVFKASNDLLTSKAGVNIDEESAKLLVQQNNYQAGAQVVKTVRDMLQTLMDAMR